MNLQEYEKESQKRMEKEFARVEAIRKRQAAGEDLILYTNVHGHLCVQGEPDPDVEEVKQSERLRIIKALEEIHAEMASLEERASRLKGEYPYHARGWEHVYYTVPKYPN